MRLGTVAAMAGTVSGLTSATITELDVVADAVSQALERVPVDIRPKLLEEPPLTQVFIARVDPRNVNDLVRTLAEHIPLQEGLGHVKRVRRTAKSGPDNGSFLAGTTPDDCGVTLDVLLAPADAWPPVMPQVVKALSKFELDTRSATVPAIPAVTREELDAWGKIWPLQYRPSKDVVIPLTGQELRAMLRHLYQAVALVNNSERDVSKTAQTQNASLFVNPETDEVVAQGIDVSIRNSDRPSERLRHAVMECIENASTTQTAKDSTPKTTRRANSDSTNIYLCTGLDVFLKREPCVMCAMALVHSRVRRVVFAECNRLQVGGLTCAQIHTERALNHRYEAFHLALDKVEALMAATKSFTTK
jgi:tRNA-specific adenosine deaminase 3